MKPSKIQNSGLFEIQTGDRSPDRIMQNRQAARVHFRRILFHSSLDHDEDCGLSDDGDARTQYKSVGTVDLFQIRQVCSSSYAQPAFHAKDSRFFPE